MKYLGVLNPKWARTGESTEAVARQVKVTQARRRTVTVLELQKNKET